MDRPAARIHDAVESAFGPSVWNSERTRVRHAGLPVDVRQIRLEHGAGRVVELTAPWPRVPLPVKVVVVERRGVSYSTTLPEVATDQRFDGQHRLVGAPASVVAEAIDADTLRSYERASEGKILRSMTVDERGASVRVPAPTEQEVSSGRRASLGVESLHAQAELVCRVIMRLSGAYESEHRRRGPNGAEEWHRQNIEVLAAEASSRAGRSRRIGCIVVAAVLAVVAAPIIWIATMVL